MRLKVLLRSFAYGIGSLIVLVGIVYVVRRYLGESYLLSTDAMAEALCKGDRILVDKLPKSPSERRNRIILFHSPLRRDSLLCPLFISRVLGIPGDTIVVKPDGYVINGREIPRAPQTLNRYFIANDAIEAVLQLMRKLAIPERDFSKESFGCTLRLTLFEEYQLRSELPQSVSNHLVGEQIMPYKLVVPRKGQAYRLDPESLVACREIIERETNGKARIESGKLFLEGRETHFFFFHNDYYWVLSDNNEAGVDSRHLGFIPADLLIGNAWFCWYSIDKQRRFKWIH